MKKIYIILLSLFLITNCFSQVVSEETKRKFSTGIDIFTDLWQELPDGVSTRTINQGVNIFGMYNIPFGKSNFSIAIGIGLSTHNFYSNSFIDDTSGTSYFYKIPNKAANNKFIGYKKNKLSVTYIDIPLEFRLKTKSKFRVALGFKGGILLCSHTKYKGDDLIDGDDLVIMKMSKIKNIDTYRYGPTFKIGYKWMNFMTYYSLSNIFRKDKGPDIYPISIGITLMPF
ncbi:MAG: PorT family protein [Bacteroidales bacterium]|nr:PorT family protein [Bacteroidales bacterium]